MMCGAREWIGHAAWDAIWEGGLDSEGMPPYVAADALAQGVGRGLDVAVPAYTRRRELLVAAGTASMTAGIWALVRCSSMGPRGQAV